MKIPWNHSHTVLKIQKFTLTITHLKNISSNQLMIWFMGKKLFSRTFFCSKIGREIFCNFQSAAHCGNFRYLLLHFFDKFFVKTTFSLIRLLNTSFEEKKFRWEWIFQFSTLCVWCILCGDLRIFLPLRFYLKSIFAQFIRSLNDMLTILEALNFNFWDFFSFFELLELNNLISRKI